MTLKKNIIWSLGLLIAVLTFNSQTLAQDTDITDDELKLYATVMAKIDGMKSEMKTKYNALIKDEPSMNGGRRFKELKTAKGDEAKLAAISATEEEITVYNKIQVEYASMTTDFKAAYPSIIKDELGAGVYNKIKKALKTDSELKSKYEEVVITLQKENEDTESVE
jgi:uncharacterized protein YktA (UPF0223 family)